MSVSSWEPDPTGRHQYRWFDGEEWTDQVADDGVQSVDPVTSSESSLPRYAPPPVPPSPAQDEPEGLSGSLPDPLTMLSSQGRRLGSIALEVVMMAVTFIVGWLIWSLIVYPRGQSPAKQLLSMRVVRLDVCKPPEFWRMALRELVLKVIPSFFLLGLLWIAINGVVLLTNDRFQTLWDKMLNTVVVDDPHDLFKPVPRPRHGPTPPQ